MVSLPDLPNELLIELATHYSLLYIGIDAVIHGELREKYAGDHAIRSLSQTCRRLRHVFLPILFSRVHALLTWRNLPLMLSRPILGSHTNILEDRMIGIRDTPYVAPLIRSLSVTLEECRYRWQPIAEFIQVLGLLPDLENLTIIDPHQEAIPFLISACEGRTFPSVRTLAIDNILGPIIPCFPNVRVLTSAGGGHNCLLESLKGKCEQISTNKLIPATVELLRDAIPNVRCIEVWDNKRLDVGALNLLQDMNALIELRYRYQAWNYDCIPREMDISAARRVLRSSKAVGVKKLRLQVLESSVLLHEQVILVREFVLNLLGNLLCVALGCVSGILSRLAIARFFFDEGL
ncbi:hypothetical protein R3P38DRAFT_3044265 [Favolaschia claudopus]|uniref:F-box domain-containing protein n=1 Tax=Favolaschia claudopus TaxID=2862362 RepID=A0AAW0A6D8_9AGAR